MWEERPGVSVSSKSFHMETRRVDNICSFTVTKKKKKSMTEIASSKLKQLCLIIFLPIFAVCLLDVELNLTLTISNMARNLKVY